LTIGSTDPWLLSIHRLIGRIRVSTWSWPNRTGVRRLSARPTKDSYGIGGIGGIGADYNQYKTVKSTFELAVAVIGVAKTHPLYRSYKP
jgi:hypothetical protein